MNRANQNALFQQTNLGLLSIRQAELNYYVSLNIAFGTQAALIGGFTYGVFTQNQVNEDESYSDIFQNIYWVTSAGTIAASVHVILTTMCIQVLGPGLSLHGPVGSMARATEGMRVEQKPVIVSFIIMMVLFSLSTVLSFWAVMSFESAIAGTIVYIIAGRQWYYYCERIYLRFYWKEAESKWHANDDDTDDDPAAVDPPLPNLHQNPIHDHHSDRVIARRTSDGYSTGGGDDRSTNADSTGTPEKKKKSFTRGIKFPKLSRKPNNDLSKNLLSSGEMSPQAKRPTSTIQANAKNAAVSTKFQVIMEGYLLKKGGYSAIDFNKEPWERRFFTLNRSAQLFMYKTRHDYREKPRQPIYHRPLSLYEFVIEVFNSEDPRPMREISIESTMSYAVDDATGAITKRLSKGTEKPLRFQITLIPKENLESTEKDENPVLRQNWILRCDTEEELEIWTSVMREISPQSFRESSNS